MKMIHRADQCILVFHDAFSGALLHRLKQAPTRKMVRPAKKSGFAP
jgi:hypothetical protein